jgi:hypothetical protein
VKNHGRNNERGLISLELTLMLPMLVFLMLFMIGMGHAIITRQRAVVAAQFSATYHAAQGNGPSGDKVSDAASAGSEQWRLSEQVTSSAGDAGAGLGGRISGLIGSALGSFVGGAGARGVIRYTAQTTPNRGILPRFYNLGDAGAKYQIANGTWTCRCGGSYLSVILPAVRIPGFSPDEKTCCETYQESLPEGGRGNQCR